MTDYVHAFLGSSTFSDFLANHWETALLHAIGALSHPERVFDLTRFQQQLASGGRALDAVPSIVDSQIARPMTAAKKKTDPLGAATAALAHSASILLPKLEATSPEIATFCRQLDNVFLLHGIPLATPVFANAYLTPPQSQGFGAHYDDHCVLVLQILGSKHWRVAKPEHPLPVDRCEEILADDCMGEPVFEKDLHPGDLLYIPRGYPHQAHCTDQTSLHVTFGIRTSTWSALLPRLADGLGRFRASIRPVTPDGHCARNYYRDTLVPALFEVDPTGPILEMLGECLSALPPLASAQTDRLLPPDLAEATRMRRAPDVLLMLAARDDAILLHFPGGPIELPAAARDALSFIAETETFTVTEIPLGHAAFSKIELVRHLVRRGILIVDRPYQQQAGNQGLEYRGYFESKSSVETPVSRRFDGDLTFFHRGKPSETSHLEWMHCAEKLTGDECDRIISACRQFDIVEPTVVGEYRLPGHRQADARMLAVNEQTAWFFELFCRVAEQATEKAYLLSLSGITRPPQYVEYHVGRGEFGWHNDYSHGLADAPRKLTIILQLSDPSDYQGGLLQIMNNEVETAPVERGSIIVLPSILTHRVTPVTCGVRRALVCWIAGPRHV